MWCIIILSICQEWAFSGLTCLITAALLDLLPWHAQPLTASRPLLTVAHSDYSTSGTQFISCMLFVLSARMSHQQFQVFNWPRSPRIMPTNDSWPLTTPQHQRPPIPSLPSSISTSLPSVSFPGSTVSQSYPGSVQDGSFFITCNLEPDNESDSWISDDENPPGLSSHSNPHSSWSPLHCCYAHGLWQHKGFWNIYKYSTFSLLESYDFNDLLVEACNALKDLGTSFEEPSDQILLCTEYVVTFIQSMCGIIRMIKHFTYIKTLWKHVSTLILMFWTFVLTYIIVYSLDMPKRDIVNTLYHALCILDTSVAYNSKFLLHRRVLGTWRYIDCIATHRILSSCDISELQTFLDIVSD